MFAQSKTLTYSYDPFGNLTKTQDALGNATILGYDLRGRKTGMADPDMGTWTYAYNALGQLVRQTDAKGQTSTIAYDNLGREGGTVTTLDTTYTTGVTYDANGRALTQSYPSGLVVKYVYTTLGYLKEIRNCVFRSIVTSHFTKS